MTKFTFGFYIAAHAQVVYYLHEASFAMNGIVWHLSLHISRNIPQDRPDPADVKARKSC